MKEITLERFAAELEQSMDAAQHEHILVTRNGLPFALVEGIAFKDEEDLALERSPEFWRMIEERRQRPTLPLEKVKAELFGDEAESED
jgi:hypothetical protein